MPNDFQTLVLCGGKGERLLPLTENRQKCTLPIQGTPFLEYLVYQIHHYGISKITFCCGYKAEDIIRHFGTFDGHEYKYSCPLDFINTGARILKAEPYYRNTNNLIIFNGDSYCNLDPETFWRLYNKFIKSESKICKLLAHKDKSLLASFIGYKYEKDYFGAGIYFIKKELLKDIEYNDKLSLEEDIILNNFNETLFIKLPNNYFVVDIGTPENLGVLNDNTTAFGRIFRDYNSRIRDTKIGLFP
jgi:NDP-sugar pyrophosphorylase family protein